MPLRNCLSGYHGNSPTDYWRKIGELSFREDLKNTGNNAVYNLGLVSFCKFQEYQDLPILFRRQPNRWVSHAIQALSSWERWAMVHWMVH